MKPALLALLTAAAAIHGAPPSPQLVERWQKSAVQKHPSLATSGSALNQRFLAIVAAKRESEPAFFEQPDWPMRAADAAAEAIEAEALAAKDRERQIFEGLIFGDDEETIVRKLGLSKVVTARATGARMALDSRFRWVIGESRFNLAFEMKEGLAAITIEPLPEDAADLDSLIHEDWERLRAAAIERFGPPSKSVPFPKADTLTRGGTTVTDTWERPARLVTLGIGEDGGKCAAVLRISNPAGGRPN